MENRNKGSRLAKGSETSEDILKFMLFLQHVKYGAQIICLFPRRIVTHAACSHPGEFHPQLLTFFAILFSQIF